MASHRCLYSDVIRPHSESPRMLMQPGHAGGLESKTNEKDVGFAPNLSANLKIKTEKIEEEDFLDRHVGVSSRPTETSVNEDQSCLKSNFPDLSKEPEYDIKEERKDAQSPNYNREEARRSETMGSTESSGEVGEAKTAEVDPSRNDGKLVHYTSDVRKPNRWIEGLTSRKEHLSNKRKIHELYAEDLLMRNDPRSEARRIPLTNHAALSFETVQWHQAKERETQNNENLCCPQYMNNTLYAAEHDRNPTFPRMKIHEIPPDYRLVDGIGRNLGARTKGQIDRNTTYFSSIDPRNRKFATVLTEEPRTRYFPGEEVYRSLQEELVHRAWYSQPNNEHYIKEDSTGSGIEDLRSLQAKERFERHLLLQEGSYWPYFDRSADRDGVYGNQRIALLTTDFHGEERNSQTKEYPFIDEQSPKSRKSMQEYCKYVQVPNMLIPTPNPELLANNVDYHGLMSIPHNNRHPFPVTEKNSIAFIEKDSVLYPCHKEGIPNHYEVMAAKARWLATRNESQRVDAFQTLKPAVEFRDNQSQADFLDEAGARIIHVNDFRCEEQKRQKKREISKDVTFGRETQHATSNKQSSLEGILQEDLERQRIIDESRRKHVLYAKDEVFIPYSTQDYKKTNVLERKASKAKQTAWQEKDYEARTYKESLKNKTWDSTKEVRPETLKNEGIGKSGNKLTDVSQKTEGTKEFQDPNDSESQPINSLEQPKPNEPSLKRISCSVCNKTFNRTSNLYTHMRTHSANKPHACEFCGKRFHQKADLRIHRYIHTGEKPHKCTKCGRGFKQLTHLKYHMRTHSDVRMYKCPYCEKGFNQKSNLQAHIFGHTGQRPHKCETCGKGFTLASTLNTHKRIHLPNKPFKCEFCDRAFYQKNALKMHYVSTHPYSSGACLV